ncbi:Uncharacterised protein [Mycobacteroides abscessus subsp. abscessus]|nr:Uncharacterised protein [Mycobacteroides abscessus subsp. abscessus]
MVGLGPIEAGALRQQDLLVEQQIQDELVVVVDVVYLGVQAWERVERTLGLDAGDAGDLVELCPGDIALLQQATTR